MSKDLLKKLEHFLGKENVFTDISTIGEIESTTFQMSRKILAYLTPVSIEQIQFCLKLANLYKTPIYPVSQGKNWGYGSQLPWQSESIVISLKKMDNILEYNEEFAYITIEAGVTFNQVYEFLKNKGDKLRNCMIGAGPNASVIGNILEKGVATGLYSDRILSCCNLRVVLPNGDIINTGFGNLKNSKIKNIYKWGIGPTFDGIFTQFNIGIVTQMTIFLYPKSNAFTLLVAIIDPFKEKKSNSTSEQIIESLKILLHERTISLCMLYSYHTFFSQDGDDANKNKWVLVVPIYSPSQPQAKAIFKRINKILKYSFIKYIILNKLKLKFFNFKIIKFFLNSDFINRCTAAYNSLYYEKPTSEHLKIAYRNKKELPQVLNPDKDKCGFMWFTPVIPLSGRDFCKALKMASNLYKKYKFIAEPHIILNSERSFYIHLPIIFNYEKESKNAIELYNEMLSKFKKAGYMPYRLGIQYEGNMLSDSKKYKDFLYKIKNTLDPNNIIAPGKYGIDKNFETKI